jgi:hypothetical protein
VSPSGKAPVFGTGIRGFESLHPSHENRPRSSDLGRFSIAEQYEGSSIVTEEEALDAYGMLCN